MQTMRMLFGILTMTAVLVGNSVVYATSTPTETVIDTLITVMGIINDPMYQQPGMSDARRAALDTELRNSVNYREMARRSLGVTWVALSESEQQRFGDLFLQVLRDALSSRMNMYSDAEVIYLGERREGNFAEVRILFRQHKSDTIVNLQLVNQSDHWLVDDAVIDGVRLIANYRSQFVHVMKEAAYVGLVAKIEAMTLLPKSFERTVMR